ncbi:MAG: amino acid permease [Candidatus Micrarchaeia archaeon]
MAKLNRTLSLFDAVNIALGSIIGAGIFVILGSAAGIAGPAVFLSVLVAAAVALMTGLASSGLSRRFPKSGGAYLFAREAISHSAGFIVGWIWLFSNIAAGATVAVGFGHYLAFFLPSVPANLAAALIVLLATAINLLGAGQSSKVNNVLVALKVLILLAFVAVSLFFFKPANFSPLAPFGIAGILAGAATIFFAYAGFARVAVIADEVKNPEVNVPKATIISIAVSTLLYSAVAVGAVGLAGWQALSESGSPLADALASVGLGFGASIIAAGALIATGTVVLSSVLGLSRLAFTMAEAKELPGWLGAIGKSSVPANSILVSGAATLLFALFADLPHIAYISSFSLLLYYAAINLSGIRILDGNARYAAFGGLLSCAILMFSLPLQSWLVGLAAVTLGILYYLLFVRERGKN